MSQRVGREKFARRRGLLTTHLNAYEVELLSSLVSQLVELVSDGEPGGFDVTEREPEDTFEAIVADLRSSRTSRSSPRTRC